MSKRSASNGRLSRDEWLAQALDILAREGQAKLRIEMICAALGVTKGSFYWHFKDRDDFLQSVVQFWSDRFTDPVMQRVTDMGGTARERIETLLRVVSEGRFARYDVSIRAWAAQDPDLLSAIVEEVDKRRLAFVGSLFTEMGFEDPEAEMRARAVVAYVCYEESVLAKSRKKDRSEMLNRFFDLITQPALTEAGIARVC